MTQNLIAPNTRALALLVASAFFMENLDATVIVTALPTMAESFGVEAVDVNIGITAYMLALAIFIPASGWIAERFGHRPVFISAVCLFTLTSVLCALSTSLWSFTFLRVLQGIAGAMMVPVGRLAVLNNTPKADLVSIIAYLTWPGLAAPVIGPPLGGFLSTYASWHWIFLLNLPLGLIALFYAYRLIPKNTPSTPPRFDFLGFALCASACAGMLYSLEWLGQTSFWHAPVALLLLSLALGWGFIRHTRQHPAPLLKLDAFNVQTYRASARGGTLFRTIVSAIPFLVPLMLQLAFNYDAFDAGLLVLSLFAGNIGIKPATGWLLRQYGFRQTLIVSNLILGLTLLGCAFLTPETPLVLVILLLLISGMARSCGFTAYTSMAFADVPSTQMSSANTLFSMLQQFAFGLGVALATVLLRLSLSVMGLETPSAAAFQWVWFCFAGLMLLSMLECWRLSPAAGAAVSRHHAFSASGATQK